LLDATDISMSQVNTSYRKFYLDDTLEPEHLEFFNKNGFIHFKNFLSKNNVNLLLNALEGVQLQWVNEKRSKVNGVPIFYGKDEEQRPMVHRFPFTSQYSTDFADLVRSARLASVTGLVPGSRLAESEKDGVVVNQYVNHVNSKMKQMGWHTDSARDLFYLQKVQPMLNVGIYLTDSTLGHGGLRVLPGTHTQGIFQTLFRKPYFVSNRPDKNEVGIVAVAGDLVIHHGAIWHRVAQPTLTGAASRRVTMYIPALTGKVQVKTEQSRTPVYHNFRNLQLVKN
jgi:phytanoyl-CoA hydroxylase